MQKTKNSVQLVGYLGKDPVVKNFDGRHMARFSVATTQFKRDENKILFREVTWHDIVVWGKEAEAIPGLFIKGSHVLVDGEIIYRDYADKNGIRHHVAEIKALKLLNLDR